MINIDKIKFTSKCERCGENSDRVQFGLCPDCRYDMGELDDWMWGDDDDEEEGFDYGTCY